MGVLMYAAPSFEAGITAAGPIWYHCDLRSKSIMSPAGLMVELHAFWVHSTSQLWQQVTPRTPVDQHSLQSKVRIHKNFSKSFFQCGMFVFFLCSQNRLYNGLMTATDKDTSLFTDLCISWCVEVLLHLMQSMLFHVLSHIVKQNSKCKKQYVKHVHDADSCWSK